MLDHKDSLSLVYADVRVLALQESKLQKERELVDLFVVIKGDNTCVSIPPRDVMANAPHEADGGFSLTLFHVAASS